MFLCYVTIINLTFLDLCLCHPVKLEYYYGINLFTCSGLTLEEENFLSQDCQCIDATNSCFKNIFSKVDASCCMGTDVIQFD